MKVWHIQTCGAGTPHYLVSAETKEEAWLKVKMRWKKKFDSWDVGGRIDDLIEIKGLTAQTSLIVDLNES